jgi:adenylate cyclase
MSDSLLAHLTESAAAAPRPPPAPISSERIRVLEVVACRPEDRPVHDTIDDIAEWLVGPVHNIESGTATFDEFAWRLVAAGMPLLRLTLHAGTIHPQFLGATIVWWRDTGKTTLVMIAHEIGDAIPYEQNPVRRVCEGRETLRRRLDLPDEQLDFPVLKELRDRGGTDYFALPIRGTFAVDYMVTFVTDRPGGFTPAEIADLMRVAQRVSVPIDRHNQWWITHHVLSAYLGARTGPKVLAGQIRRGAGIELTAILWSSDLRGFTERSDRLPSERMIAILNALFDAQAVAIGEHSGEILKFIGDGILAIFPIEEPEAAPDIARGAVAAARAAIDAVRGLADDPIMAGEPPLEIVVALHVGTVNYGNIGAADRLDFTVIGPAVNLVSRIETVAKALAKALDYPIVVSGELAQMLGGEVVSVGRHELRGLATPRELFVPA